MSNGQKRDNYQHKSSPKIVETEIKSHANNRTLKKHCTIDRSVNFHMWLLIRGVCFTRYLLQLLLTGIKCQKTLFSSSLKFKLEIYPPKHVACERRHISSCHLTILDGDKRQPEYVTLCSQATMRSVVP